PTKAFDWSKRDSKWVKFEICGGIFPEKLQLYSFNFVNSFKFPIQEGNGPDNPQLTNRRTVREVRFEIHNGMDPTSCNPDTSKNSKDLSSPIEEGSIPENPLAPRPNF